jgi:hypothetical protein
MQPISLPWRRSRLVILAYQLTFVIQRLCIVVLDDARHQFDTLGLKMTDEETRDAAETG